GGCWAATRAMSRHAVPTRRACDIPARLGYARVSIAEKALVDTDVGVDAPVAQERPVAPHVLETFQVERSDENRFRIGRCLGEDHAEGIGEERMSPELETGTLAVELLESDAVHRGDVAAVGDRMAALDGAPGLEL